MKKLISFFLAALIMGSMLGCKKEPSTLFYYPRKEILYDVSDGVICVEPRDLAGMEHNLEYLIKLYLEGPISQDLRSPFPAGTALVSVTRENETITVTLSETLSKLDNLEYTIACGCIASTCFSLTEEKAVTICSGETEMTITRDNLFLWDQAVPSTPE